MITLSPEHWAARMRGTLELLNEGGTDPFIRVYDGVRAATTAEAPSGVLLASVPLARPAGILTGAVLTLRLAEVSGLVVTTGEASWARVINGAGVVVFDCDIGSGPGPWEITINKTRLLLGGYCQIISAVLR